MPLVDSIPQEAAAFDHEWKNGDRAVAKQLAKDYVEAHRADLEANLQAATRALRESRLDNPPSLVDLVDLVSAYRGMGREADRILVDMWLLSEQEPQNITGELHLAGVSVAQIVSEAQAIATGRGG